MCVFYELSHKQLVLQPRYMLRKKLKLKELICRLFTWILIKLENTQDIIVLFFSVPILLFER